MLKPIDYILKGNNAVKAKDYVLAAINYRLAGEIFANLEKKEDFIIDDKSYELGSKAYLDLSKYYAYEANEALVKDLKINRVDRYGIYESKYNYEVDDNDLLFDDSLVKDSFIGDFIYKPDTTANNLLLIGNEKEMVNIINGNHNTLDKLAFYINAFDLFKDAEYNIYNIQNRLIDIKYLADHNMWCSIVITHADLLLKDFNLSRPESIGVRTLMIIMGELFALKKDHKTSLICIADSKDNIPDELIKDGKYFDYVIDTTK